MESLPRPPRHAPSLPRPPRHAPSLPRLWTVCAGTLMSLRLCAGGDTRVQKEEANLTEE